MIILKVRERSIITIFEVTKSRYTCKLQCNRLFFHVYIEKTNDRTESQRKGAMVGPI